MKLLRNIALTLALGLTAAAPAAAQSTATVTSSAIERLREYRTSAGLAPLRRDPRLDAAARQHALWIARTGRYGHTGQGGSRLTDRAAAHGYCYRGLAENIAYGIPTSEQVIDGWMSSPGHRRNTLMPTFRDYGIAGANGYWVMLIGQSC